MNQLELIQFDPSAAINAGFSRDQFDDVLRRLDQARCEILDVDLKLLAEGAAPPSKQPLDAGFIELPDRLLQHYEQTRRNSELGKILGAARRLADQVDSIVILGIGGSYLGARALMDACCQPFHNELARGQRGGWPRVYFDGNSVDNDATQGLLFRLAQLPAAGDLAGRWGLLVISKSGGTLETAVSFRQFLRAWQKHHSGHSTAGQLVIPITGAESKLARLAAELGCQSRFPVPEAVGGRFSVFSAVGLLPAALLGLDIVQLLRGAWLMNAHFRSAPASENLVLQYVAANHLAEQQCGATIRVMSCWSKALETFGWWYDQLLSESLGKDGQGATPITAVNTRDLHSRHQQHQCGRRDKMINHIVVDRWRCDPLPLGSGPSNADGLDELAEGTLPQFMAAAYQGTDQALRDVGRLATTIRLQSLREFTLGQLMQMLMLATVVEGRYLGVNPYGQPGVEAYKANMIRILQKEQVGVSNGD